MENLDHLLESNRNWAAAIVRDDPTFFEKLAAQQAPRYLWIGCSDSRVPANQIVGLMPGDLFVHRNVANVVVHTDLNCLSVIHYAVEALNVRHIIVCGHYGCGGVTAAYRHSRLGLIDNWLRHVQDIQTKHTHQLSPLPSQTARVDRLCELNVIEQVRNVCRTTIVQDAWQRQQEISVHGWIYSIQDGLIRDLGVTIDKLDQIESLSGAAAA